MEAVNIAEELEELRNTFESGKTRSYEWRRAQLRGLLKLLKEEEEGIFRAVEEDVGKHHVEVYRDEIGYLIKSCNYALDNLKKWMKSKKVSLPLATFPSTAKVVPEPLGVVLIFSSWNFPMVLSIDPLIGAISAGNTVVVKPSELAPASADFIAKYLPIYIDSKAIKIIQGGTEVGQELLQQKWDKIFFTGSSRVGRMVMAAAANHLTPVVLELGGKCPAILDSISSSWDKKVAIERIVGGKWGPCNGQACIGIDFLIVEEKYLQTAVDLLKATISKFYPDRDFISRIINKQHFQRLSDLLKDPAVSASIVHGGPQDVEKLLMEPTILVNPPLEAEIMTEEIFGPLLPIITVEKIEDSIEFLKKRPKPLVIYAFTNDKNFKRRLIEETSSGSVTFNDAIVQFACDTIPFGGVGQSGFGSYHGKFSFDTFSHGKSVVKRSFLLEFSFRYPPWNEKKLLLMRYLYKFDYLNFILVLFGLKKK